MFTFEQKVQVRGLLDWYRVPDMFATERYTASQGRLSLGMFTHAMTSEVSAAGTLLDGRAALLAEVETALALIGLARVSSEPETARRLHENTRQSYARVMELLPTGVRAMTLQEKDAMWARIDPVRQWLEATAWLLLPRSLALSP